jgi:hypothetical protein
MHNRSRGCRGLRTLLSYARHGQKRRAILPVKPTRKLRKTDGRPTWAAFCFCGKRNKELCENLATLPEHLHGCRRCAPVASLDRRGYADDGVHDGNYFPSETWGYSDLRFQHRLQTAGNGEETPRCRPIPKPPAVGYRRADLHDRTAPSRKMPPRVA